MAVIVTVTLAIAAVSIVAIVVLRGRHAHAKELHQGYVLLSHRYIVVHVLIHRTNEIKEPEATFYNRVEDPEYEVIRDDLAGGQLPSPHTQEEFALKACPAYVPTTALSLGDVAGPGEGVPYETPVVSIKA